MIKAYKLDKHIKKIIASNYDECAPKLRRINFTLTFILYAFVIMIPIISIIVAKNLEMVPTLGIDAVAIFIWTLVFIIFTYRSTLSRSFDYKNKLKLMEECSVSFISWKFYKFFKVAVFTIGLSLLLYALDSLNIVNVYYEYYDSNDRFVLFNMSFEILFILLIVNIFHIAFLLFKNVGLYAFLAPATMFLTLSAYVWPRIGEEYVEEGNYSFRHISKFNIIDNEALRLLAYIFILIILKFTLLKLTEQMLRRRIYDN